MLTSNEIISAMAGSEFDRHTICQSLNICIQKGWNSVHIKKIDNPFPESVIIEWCGPDFLVTKCKNTGEYEIIPLNAITSINFRHDVPFPLFDNVNFENQLVDGLKIQSTSWKTIGAAQITSLPSDGIFSAPVRFDGQSDWHRIACQTPLLHMNSYELAIAFKSTSERICIYISGTETVAIRGSIGGSLFISSSALGEMRYLDCEDMGQDYRRISLQWTPAREGIYSIGIGDDGGSGHIDIYGVGLAATAD